MMSDDEREIRELAGRWMELTKAGDVEGVLGLMSEEVLFMSAGREPFGKKAFEAGMRGMAGMGFDGSSEVLEVAVAGAWAWMRCRLRVEMGRGEKRVVRGGEVLSVLRKEGGRWVVLRDGNMVG